jgi:hypothetical protein
MAWRTANSLIRLREQINAMAPNRSKASDGTIGDASHQTRDSDHNPWVRDGATGVVTAMDITEDSGDGCSAEAIVEALVRSRDPRIKYIIWDRKIISSSVSPWAKRDYNGRNPHTKHFHISVLPDKAQYDSTADWTIV